MYVLSLRRSPRKRTPVRTPVAKQKKKVVAKKSSSGSSSKKKRASKKKKKKKNVPNSPKILQKSVTCAFLAKLWPPGNSRKHLYRVNELVYEKHDKFKGDDNPGVGPSLGIVKEIDVGRFTLVHFWNEKDGVDEEMSRKDIAPCMFGELYPDTKAVWVEDKQTFTYYFKKPRKEGAMVMYERQPRGGNGNSYYVFIYLHPHFIVFIYLYIRRGQRG